MSRKTEKKRRMSAGRILDTGMTYLILLAVAFVFFFPCLWLILASFSKSGTIYSFDGFFPAGYSLVSFQNGVYGYGTVPTIRAGLPIHFLWRQAAASSARFW